MKSKKFTGTLAMLGLLGILASCNGANSSQTSSASSQQGSSSSASSPADVSSDTSSNSNWTSSFDPSYPDDPDDEDDVEDNPSRWSLSDFRSRLSYIVDQPEMIRNATLESRRFVNGGTTGTGANEYEKTDYTYYNGGILVGEVENRTATGYLDYEVDPESGYDVEAQAYPEGDYLVYAEKAPKGADQISYMQAYKSNRYQNLYTLYVTTRHIAVAEDALLAVDGQYWTEEYTVKAPTIGVKDGKATLRIEAGRPDSYGYGAAEEWVEVTLDEESGAFLTAEYGFFVYPAEASLDDPSQFSSIRVDKISNVTYGGWTDFDGDFIREGNVDKVYSSPQTRIDYSSWADGALSDAQADLILKNIQAFAKGTTRSTIEFTRPDFINVYDGYYGADPDTGDYIVGGTLSGKLERKLYEGDFVRTTGTMSYVYDEENIDIVDSPYCEEATADDDGIVVIEDYGDALSTIIPNHKHVLKGEQIEDVDPYIGVNPVFDEEAALPALKAGEYGINAQGASDEYESVTYTNSGTITKEGDVLKGTLSVDEHYIWTPYRRFYVTFTIDDGFLSDYSFSCETYRFEQELTVLELDAAEYEYHNYKDEAVSAFDEARMNPTDYEEPTVEDALGYPEVITIDKEKLYL